MIRGIFRLLSCTCLLWLLRHNLLLKRWFIFHKLLWYCHFWSLFTSVCHFDAGAWMVQLGVYNTFVQLFGRWNLILGGFCVVFLGVFKVVWNCGVFVLDLDRVIINVRARWNNMGLFSLTDLLFRQGVQTCRFKWTINRIHNLLAIALMRIYRSLRWAHMLNQFRFLLASNFIVHILHLFGEINRIGLKIFFWIRFSDCHGVC